MIPWSSLASSTWMFFIDTYDWAIAILIGPVNLIFYCKILCSYSILSFQDFSRINIIFFFFLCCLIWFCLSISQDMTSSCNKLVSPLFSGHILLTVLKVLLMKATKTKMCVRKLKSSQKYCQILCVKTGNWRWVQ